MASQSRTPLAPTEEGFDPNSAGVADFLGVADSMQSANSTGEMVPTSANGPGDTTPSNGPSSAVGVTGVTGVAHSVNKRDADGLNASVAFWKELRHHQQERRQEQVQVHEHDGQQTHQQTRQQERQRQREQAQQQEHVTAHPELQFELRNAHETAAKLERLLTSAKENERAFFLRACRLEKENLRLKTELGLLKRSHSIVGQGERTPMKALTTSASTHSSSSSSSNTHQHQTQLSSTPPFQEPGSAYAAAKRSLNFGVVEYHTPSNPPPPAREHGHAQASTYHTLPTTLTPALTNGTSTNAGPDAHQRHQPYGHAPQGARTHYGQHPSRQVPRQTHNDPYDPYSAHAQTHGHAAHSDPYKTHTQLSLSHSTSTRNSTSTSPHRSPHRSEQDAFYTGVYDDHGHGPGPGTSDMQLAFSRNRAQLDAHRTHDQYQGRHDPTSVLDALSNDVQAQDWLAMSHTNAPTHRTDHSQDHRQQGYPAPPMDSDGWDLPRRPSLLVSSHDPFSHLANEREGNMGTTDV